MAFDARPAARRTRGALFILLLSLGIAACSKKEESKPSGASAPKSDAALTVGFVYVGPRDDYGYDQAHAEGAKSLTGLPGVKVLEEG